jgi:hypothetical protein
MLSTIIYHVSCLLYDPKSSLPLPRFIDVSEDLDRHTGDLRLKCNTCQDLLHIDYTPGEPITICHS